MEELNDIEIKTVDGFEGREKDVIVFSTVRCNPMGFIGFLADWRRLNVGITRAKRVSGNCCCRHPCASRSEMSCLPYPISSSSLLCITASALNNEL